VATTARAAAGSQAVAGDGAAATSLGGAAAAVGVGKEWASAGHSHEMARAIRMAPAAPALAAFPGARPGCWSTTTLADTVRDGWELEDCIRFRLQSGMP
jgi:hypothetical protein